MSLGLVTDLSNQPYWVSTNVAAWAFGNTHFSCYFTDKLGKQVLENQKGYYIFPQKAFQPETTLQVKN
jgi:hypothetical protein